jgi:hypothetical protein
MADHYLSVSTNTLLHTGVGQVMGLIATSNSGAPQVSLFDNTSGSGVKIFDCFVSYLNFLHIFFPEKYALYFGTGLYVSLDDNVVLNIWWRTL